MWHLNHTLLPSSKALRRIFRMDYRPANLALFRLYWWHKCVPMDASCACIHPRQGLLDQWVSIQAYHRDSWFHFVTTMQWAVQRTSALTATQNKIELFTYVNSIKMVTWKFICSGRCLEGKTWLPGIDVVWCFRKNSSQIFARAFGAHIIIIKMSLIHRNITKMFIRAFGENKNRIHLSMQAQNFCGLPWLSHDYWYKAKEMAYHIQISYIKHRINTLPRSRTHARWASANRSHCRPLGQPLAVAATEEQKMWLWDKPKAVIIKTHRPDHQLFLITMVLVL